MGRVAADGRVFSGIVPRHLLVVRPPPVERRDAWPQQVKSMSHREHEAHKEPKRKPKLSMKEKRALKKAKKHAPEIGAEIHQAVK